MSEILTQVNVPYAFFAMVANLQPGRHRYTYELMSAALKLSGLAVMRFKHFFRVRRPADRSALVQPVLLTPNHGAYPAGHSTQCGFLAHVLKDLIGASRGADLDAQLDALALRISDNRVVAGVHFEEDMTAGLALGKELGDYFLRKAKVGGQSPLGWLWTKASNEQWI